MYSVFEEERQEGFDEGLEQGIERGRLDGIAALIESLQELEISYPKTWQQLMVKFSLAEDTAQEYMDKFWKG